MYICIIYKHIHMQWDVIQSLKKKYKKDLHDSDNHDGMIT